MSNKVQNILRNIGFLLSVPVIIGAFVFAVAEDKSSTVRSIEVDILNSEFGFVTSQDVEYSLMSKNIVLDHTAIAQLNIAALEEEVNSNPWVEHAEVFVTSTQNIRVILKQVQPKLRVQRTDSTANGYYLDEKGFMIPLSKKYSADLPILTSERRITNIDQRKDLVKLAQFIEQDTFWRATIAQINLDQHNDIELVSLIGDANIRFGSTENMIDKFFRLFQFYKKGMNRINWANVKELDLRFDKQLVCRRYHKEQHVEEASAPKLYTETKTKQVVSNTEQIRMPEVVKHQQKAAEKETIVQHKEPAASRIEKVVSEQKKSSLKVSAPVEAKAVAKKTQPKKERIKEETPKRIEEKKSTVQAEVKPELPKPTPRKKKREIIINTEPVTSKNATQK